MEFGKSVLCRSCGANLTETSPGSYARKMDEAHGVIERIYRNVLSGAPLDAWFARRSHGNSVSPVRRRPCPNPCLVPKSGAVPTAYRPAESVSLVQTRNPSNHRGSRVECDSSFATPCTKQKFQEGLKLCMRVFALLSPRDAEWIENASELWPPVLRRRLNSALDQHERSRSLASPFRSMFFHPGFKCSK